MKKLEGKVKSFRKMNWVMYFMRKLIFRYRHNKNGHIINLKNNPLTANVHFFQ